MVNFGQAERDEEVFGKALEKLVSSSSSCLFLFMIPQMTVLTATSSPTSAPFIYPRCTSSLHPVLPLSLPDLCFFQLPILHRVDLLLLVGAMCTWQVLCYVVATPPTHPPPICIENEGHCCEQLWNYAES